MAIAYGWYLNPVTLIDWTVAEARQRKIGRGGDLMVGEHSPDDAG